MPNTAKGLPYPTNADDVDVPGDILALASAVDSELDDYATKASPTFTGTVVLPSTTSIGNVSATELGYVDGVTSAVQTQLDAKAVAGSNGVPFRMAAGTATTGSNISVTVTLPSNRFTQTPIVTATVNDAAYASVMIIYSTSTTSFIMQGFNGSAYSAIRGNWIAIQMTSGAGAG